MNVLEVLEAVRRVELRTNRLVNDVMVGAYLSQFKGRGMDFEELREYIPGDDVRDIDWNVTFRLGRPFVKKFREERELPIILALDISASEAFGSGRLSKREFATEVAATLAFSAARNGDKVGLLLFTDRIELFVPPKKGRRHLLRLIREMLSFVPQQKGTHIPTALAFLNRVLPRRSLVFLLTDFLHSLGQPAARLDAGRGTAKEMGLTNARHDLVCVHLCDPRESDLPEAGRIVLEDAETGELMEVDTVRASIRQAYAETNAARIQDLDLALRQTGVDTLRLNTAEPFAQAVQHFFELRRRR